MEQRGIDDPSWLSGLNLAERVAWMRRRPAGSELDPERAARRLTRWRAQKGFAGDDLAFARRLSGEGVTEDELLRALGEPPHPYVEEAPPWLTALAEALAAPQPGPGLPPLPAWLEGQPAAELLRIAAPMIEQGRARVRRGAEAIARKLPSAPFDPATLDALVVVGLTSRLSAILTRTMVLELHVARLEGRLAGETADARFRSFVESLGRDAVQRALFHEYPVLARQIVTTVDAWVEANLEFLQRLGDDADLLREQLGGGRDLGALSAVESGAGDYHRGGRAVMLLTFTSGLRVVYKPKPLAVDTHFQELLAFCNEHGQSPPLRTLRVLDRGGYGWTEVVARRPCSDAAAVTRFYQRQGATLALFYVLLATDGHFENILPAGEHPVVVDLETLFHPHAAFASGQGLEAEKVASTSVLRSGLLPSHNWASDASEGIDTSGLGSTAGQLSPRPSQYWADTGTDQMRMARKRLEIAGGSSRPILDGAEVDAFAYVDAVAEGFAHTYRILAAHRAELLRFLARFSDDPVRVIVRPTHLYTLLLRESHHPDMLRDALDRDRFFDRLWTPVSIMPYLERLIVAERASLWRGDVPMFTTTPGSRDVLGPGGERVARLFEHSGLDLARRRIEALGEEDLERQLWFVRASFAAVEMTRGEPRLPAHTLAEPARPLDRVRLLAVATAIGDRLERLALREGDEVSWVGLSPLQGRVWSAAPLGIDLYSGIAGIALFLAHLGALTGEGRFDAVARAAARTIRRRAAVGEPRLRSIGGFSGWGGVVYTLAHLGALWGDAELLAGAERAVAPLADLVDADQSLDFLGGAAGAAAALLGLHRLLPSDRALSTAARCGARLVSKAVTAGEGLGWATPLSERPLLGLAHGAAGMALALTTLFEATREAVFRETALAALAFEDGELAKGPWPGGRATWCHGAAGIGLGRLSMLDSLEAPGAEAILETAARKTLEEGFGESHCLCHGDLGSLELLSHAATRRGDPAFHAAVQRRAAAVLESVETIGPRSGTPRGVETPGLMVGLSGIGYGLLRLAEPERVPSVMSLALPTVQG